MLSQGPLGSALCGETLAAPSTIPGEHLPAALGPIASSPDSCSFGAAIMPAIASHAPEVLLFQFCSLKCRALLSQGTCFPSSSAASSWRLFLGMSRQLSICTECSELAWPLPCALEGTTQREMEWLLSPAAHFSDIPFGCLACFPSSCIQRAAAGLGLPLLPPR